MAGVSIDVALLPTATPAPVMRRLHYSGVGLRHPHHAQALVAPGLQAAPAFVEVHAENFFGDGGPALRQLEAARAVWPVSLHGVGLALGSAAGLDAWHLDRLARLVQHIDPVHVSDHACFGRAALVPGGPVQHGCDLLPVAFTSASLALMVAHVQQVQDRLRRPILVENLAAYVHWADDAIAEPDFFNTLARRSGCGVLLDVNNLLVNARNRNELDPEAACREWIARIEVGRVGEIHVAGHARVDGLCIDDHGSAVEDTTWRLFHFARERFADAPGLLEWDTDLPSLDRLLAEVAKASTPGSRA